MCLTPASIAQADDDSFEAAVGGIFHSFWTPDQMLRMGHGICSDLRGGKTAEQEIATAPPTMPLAFDVPATVHAAQHELCPDTLR